MKTRKIQQEEKKKYILVNNTDDFCSPQKSIIVKQTSRSKQSKEKIMPQWIDIGKHLKITKRELPSGYIRNLEVQNDNSMKELLEEDISFIEHKKNQFTFNNVPILNKKYLSHFYNFLDSKSKQGIKFVQIISEYTKKLNKSNHLFLIDFKNQQPQKYLNFMKQLFEKWLVRLMIQPLIEMKKFIFKPRLRGTVLPKFNNKIFWKKMLVNLPRQNIQRANIYSSINNQCQDDFNSFQRKIEKLNYLQNEFQFPSFAPRRKFRHQRSQKEKMEKREKDTFQKMTIKNTENSSQQKISERLLNAVEQLSFV